MPLHCFQLSICSSLCAGYKFKVLCITEGAVCFSPPVLWSPWCRNKLTTCIYLNIIYCIPPVCLLINLYSHPLRYLINSDQANDWELRFETIFCSCTHVHTHAHMCTRVHTKSSKVSHFPSVPLMSIALRCLTFSLTVCDHSQWFGYHGIFTFESSNRSMAVTNEVLSKYFGCSINMNNSNFGDQCILTDGYMI